jgi:hypothetical protein
MSAIDSVLSLIFLFLYLYYFQRIADKELKEQRLYDKTHYYINRKWVLKEKFKGIRITTDWLDLL